jgi:hypothetical protein
MTIWYPWSGLGWHLGGFPDFNTAEVVEHARGSWTRQPLNSRAVLDATGLQIL